MSPHETAVTGWFSFITIFLLHTIADAVQTLSLLDEKTKTYFVCECFIKKSFKKFPQDSDNE
jgi:hypothetical protein